MIGGYTSAEIREPLCFLSYSLSLPPNHNYTTFGVFLHSVAVSKRRDKPDSKQRHLKYS